MVSFKKLEVHNIESRIKWLFKVQNNNSNMFSYPMKTETAVSFDGGYEHRIASN